MDRKGLIEILEESMQNDWVYEVLPSADCPLAVAHPYTWGTGDDIETLPAHRLTLMADW
jgi:hypothetical protein